MTVLAAAGIDNPKLLSATIWLADMRHFDDMNAVWDRPRQATPAA